MIQYVVSSYRDRIVKSLYELQRKNCLCDLEFTTSIGAVNAHKVILAICESPLLQESVSVVDKVSVLGKTKINCDEYSQEVVESLVKYLYTGEIDVSDENTEDFTKLCQSFKLTNVLDEFINHVIKQNITNGSRHRSMECGSSIGTCENLTTLSEVAHKLSSEASEGFIDISNKTSKKMRLSKKSDSIKIECSDVANPCENKYTHFKPSSVDDDENTVDLEDYKLMKEVKSSIQESLINSKDDFNTKTETRNSVNMFLMSPEHNPYYETPDTSFVKKPRIEKLKTSKTSKSKANNKKPIKTRTARNTKVKKSSCLRIKIKKNKVDEKSNEEVVNEQTKELKPKRKRGIIHRWCRKCDVRLPEKDLRKHMRTKHPPYSCKLCEWTGLLKRELALHMYSKHEMLIMPDKYPLLHCDHEGCTFKSLISYALDRHKECHNRLVRHLCDVCGSSFATAGGLKEHSLRHAEENPIYKCQICDAVFGWKCKLKSHEMREHGTYLLCEFCTYKTKYKDKLTMHLHHEHEQPLPPNQKIHRCDECDFYCINRSKLRFHKMRHSGEKNYTCPQCGKSYLNQHQMKIHYNSTHGDRTFSCHLCPYASKRKSELNNHIKSRHSDDRPFTCNLCEYSCKLRGNLHKHLRLVHKVEVVTRNQLHQNMLETGKGYTQLIDARRKDEIVIQENAHVSKPEKQHRLPGQLMVPLPVPNVENYPERIYEHRSPSKDFSDSFVRRNLEMVGNEVNVVTERNVEPFTTAVTSSGFHSVTSVAHSEGYS